MSQRPKRLEARNTAGAGMEIFADIDFEPCCVEFTMKKGFQPIVKNEALNPRIQIAYDTWIQFPPKEWEEMVEQVFNEMVDLWNEKYGEDDE